MVLNEDQECSVCYERYSRSKHIPRVLFCNHTFCSPCLETMSIQRSGMLSVTCPICRRVSCLGRGLALEEALWVNSHLWDRIPENPDLEILEKDVDGAECEKEKRRSTIGAVASSMQLHCRLRPSFQHDRLRLRLPRFLKKMIKLRQPEERIVSGCNVLMKSWRRLSLEEMP